MKHYSYILACLLVFASCKSIEKDDNATKSNSMEFFVGTYTDGESEGIYKYELSEGGHIQLISLAVKSENPSFLALTKDKKHLLAVNEVGEGKIESFSVEGDSLRLVDSSTSAGTSPCFITVNGQGFVLAANYSSGTVSLLQLEEGGGISEPLDVQQHSGSGSTPRQEGPHAHSIYFTADDREVISVDLGTNELWFFDLNQHAKKLEPKAPFKLAMESGAGPRHLAFHPSQNFLYALNELNSTVSVIEKTTESYEVKKTYSALPDDFNGESYGADIHISSDGKFLYTSNRGHNSIAIFEVGNEGETLRLVDTVDVEGDWPRNFALSPGEEFLVVANQHSNNLVSFRRDNESGKLALIMRADAPTPVNVLFE